MDPHVTAALIAAVIAALTTLVVQLPTMLMAWQKLRARDDTTDRRVDHVWDAHLRRGRLEAQRKHYVLDTAPDGRPPLMPLTLSPEARTAYDPIAPALKALRRAQPADVTEGRLGEIINEKFGLWLTTYICPVLRVQDFACLEMARLVAIEEDTLPPTTTNGTAPKDGTP